MSEAFENHIRQIARNLPYPPTPVLRVPAPRRPRTPLLRYAALIVLILGLSGLAVPDLRAAIVDFLHIGAATIYLDGRSATGEALDLSQVSGETTLDGAQAAVDFPLLVPPDDPPDRVFVQDEDLVILVWIAGDGIDMALYQTADDSWEIIKSVGSLVETYVDGHRAYWVSVQHPVQFDRDGETQTEWTHFVTGNVLGWEQEGITYRLETYLLLDEARILAASLVPLQ